MILRCRLSSKGGKSSQQWRVEPLRLWDQKTEWLEAVVTCYCWLHELSPIINNFSSVNYLSTITEQLSNLDFPDAAPSPLLRFIKIAMQSPSHPVSRLGDPQERTFEREIAQAWIAQTWILVKMAGTPTYKLQNPQVFSRSQALSSLYCSCRSTAHFCKLSNNVKFKIFLGPSSKQNLQCEGNRTGGPNYSPIFPISHMQILFHFRTYLPVLMFYVSVCTCYIFHFLVSFVCSSGRWEL
jgi:hypothetical protein